MSLPTDMQPTFWGTLKRGTFGVGVATWQAVLESCDYDITDPVGQFQASTHNATMAWQRLRGLTIDGIVGKQSRGAILDHPERRQSFIEVGSTCLEGIPFTQAVHLGIRGDKYASRNTVNWIVLHSMEAPESATRAEVVADWFADPKRAPRASAHYNVDCDSIVQSVREDNIAWHAPGANHHGIGIEHAGYARQTARQWRDGFSEPMLLRSAWLAARAALRWSIPVQYVDREGLRDERRGITTHNEVTYAWRKSTHTDPGAGFPVDWYIDRVSKACEILQLNAAKDMIND